MDASEKWMITLQYTKPPPPPQNECSSKDFSSNHSCCQCSIQLSPPNSSDDICLLFCVFLLLYDMKVSDWSEPESIVSPVTVTSSQRRKEKLYYLSSCLGGVVNCQSMSAFALWGLWTQAETVHIVTLNKGIFTYNVETIEEGLIQKTKAKVVAYAWGAESLPRQLFWPANG